MSLYSRLDFLVEKWSFVWFMYISRIIQSVALDESQCGKYPQNNEKWAYAAV